MNAIVYSRVSTDAQERDGTSLATQERACIEYAASRGFAVVDRVRDTASGFTLERPGLARVRSEALAGDIDVVLAYALDRLSRKQTHVAILVEEMEQLGVAIDFVTEDFEDTATGQLLRSVKAFAAELEREKIAEPTMRGKIERARSGRLPQGTGRGMYGYTYNRQTGKREVQGEQAAVVRRIFADFLSGKSCNRMANELNDRRTVLRSAAGALAPELRALGLVEPIQHVNRAIQEVAEKVGGGYRLPVGKPRHRGRPAPSASELDALLTNLGADEGWAGQRNVLFFGILAATGVRVRALLEIDGRDICLMGDGTVRLFLHDKASGGRFELELPCHFRDPLDAYFAAVNLSLVGRGKGRVGFGKAGAVWRGPNGKRWSTDQMRHRLRIACREAEIPDYTPHSFRAYFATQATSIAPRRVAALAGGWRGTERMDDHYVGVPRDAIERKLARIGVSRPGRRESLPDRQAAAARILSAAPGARATAEPVRADRLPA